MGWAKLVHPRRRPSGGVPQQRRRGARGDNAEKRGAAEKSGGALDVRLSTGEVREAVGVVQRAARVLTQGHWAEPAAVLRTVVPEVEAAMRWTEERLRMHMIGGDLLNGFLLREGFHEMIVKITEAAGDPAECGVR